LNHPVHQRSDRQVPILSFIVDFACLRAKLAIEVDGGGHLETRKRAEDQARDRRLRNAGWLVLRYSNGHVMARAEEAGREIREVAAQRIPRRPPAIKLATTSTDAKPASRRTRRQASAATQAAHTCKGTIEDA
jgi:hypothetical protein